MRSIGGYFGLELKIGNPYHRGAVQLNTARNAFEYILRAKKYSKIYVPTFTCEAVIEPLLKLQIAFERYQLNDQLEPIFDFKKIQLGEAFLYTNYFALKDDFILKLKNICPSLIIDNAQAFFSKPIDRLDTFYSPRKYFGIPDGAYLHTNKHLDYPIPRDTSIERFEHLLRRIDISAEDGFSYFQENDLSLVNQEIREMSNLTKGLLGTIDYLSIQNTRKENFSFLHEKIGHKNVLDSSLLNKPSTFCYPLLMKDGNHFKKELIKRKIYLPTYWPNIGEKVKDDSIEADLIENLLCLPIDQRYSTEDMSHIIKTIQEIEKEG